MSAGRFNTTAKYETNTGDIRPIKVQPETIQSWNPEATGTSQGAFVKVSGGRRGYGTHARMASFKWKNDIAPSGYDNRGSIRIAMLTATAANNLTYGTDYDYLGQSLNLVGFTPERSK
jgi:hypothetical protein